MGAELLHFFAERAWVQGRWASGVRMAVGDDGLWREIAIDTPPLPGARRLQGAVLPGLVNAHSHAFQRAMAGLTERGGAAQDDFWQWRDRMYSAALRIAPQQLEAIAAFLYAELLRAGYTQVCEFHYLHNDVDGRPYADALEMSRALLRAAARTGIGLTLLPTLYMRSGFGAPGLRDDQRRFASTPDGVLRIAEAVMREGAPGRVRAGVALHSLRAVPEGALREVAAAATQARLPVHIHIAEQVQEVDDCLAHHGSRPIEWLLAHAQPDARWNLVHATHTLPAELAGLKAAGASIVICPSTEANLGDGVFELPGWLVQGGRWSIGSDSHVTRSWQEELRLLEYSQRFARRARNVAARAAGQEASAAVLFEGALQGGTAAAGLPLAGLAVGQRADFMVLDGQAPALAGVPMDHLLDALVFSSPETPPATVFVAGREVAAAQPQLRDDFIRAMRALWGG
ncbi:formimidoylglutamate deiminase [Ramlibacter sp.]|uniref:formimidoylglutamate deiminase n=1 Tax=Ramlibacter sp. TaxID=1917967 RepID=UPI001817B64E|nr:formimidoylglutamate deiminase [Ramlibacter sp.]MBA2676274.1 formimidoylglutamate deiminase [Ramlibacter sp.]